MNILVSACILGINCRYNGSQNTNIAIEQKIGRQKEPSEIKEGKVFSKSGTDITFNYNKGAEECLRIAKMFDCRYAIFKDRSPSCGGGKIYDGTFSGILIEGDGTAAALLKNHGITVIPESRAEEFFKGLEG